MRTFAISDLHLSLSGEKPMDIFGDHWADHEPRMREAWDAMVGPEDWVLCGGDTSWGMTYEEAKPDLDWLGERKGSKVLIRGNHCLWWDRTAKARDKLQALVHPSIRLLNLNAIKLPDDSVVVGSRLWDPPDAPWADTNAPKVFARELGFLRTSIAEGKKLAGRRMLALVHYPPRYTDGRETEAVKVLEEAGVSHCVYGHLHGKDLVHGFVGEHHGIRYYLASVDAIDFKPIPLPA
jgi:predicted phosphohydrolase